MRFVKIINSNKEYCMKFIDLFSSLVVRFRYPVSLPEDIAKALGLKLSNRVCFDEFVSQLTNPQIRPTKLTKFMPRDLAELAFQNAPRKECFKKNTLCSYYFNEGWLEFALEFDELSRLRRIYIHHRKISMDQGVELRLNKIPQFN